MSLTSSDLELAVDGSSTDTVGMRFTSVTIPKGATITNAYIQFTTDETNSAAVSLTIRGQAADDPATFTTTTYDITSRATTSASVAWSPAAWNTVGEAAVNQRTPDISTILQEIVDRSGWSSGNSLVIIVTGTGTRTAEAYDSGSATAPLLHVEYATSAHWKLNETSGTTAADSSGFGNTGTVTGTSSWGSAVRKNGFSFNGATKIQATGLISSPTNFTVACWANVTAAGTAGANAISLGDYVTLRPHQVNGNGPTVTFYRGSTAYVQAQLANSSYIGTGWHHFAGTFDDASNSLNLYIDGVLVATTTTTYSISWSGLGSNTVLGSHGNGGTGYGLTGAIDDARVYGRALSATEIAELYGFIGHWKLAETSGATAADSTVFAQNGTVTGGASWTTDCGGNGAFNFDGSTKYISIADASHLKPTESLSIAGWIKGDSWGSSSYVAPILRKGESNPNNYQLQIEDGYVALSLDGNDGSGIRSTTQLSTGEWYHVAGTWDGSTAKIYVNGALETSTARTGTIATDTRALYIGGRSGTDYHDGMLRDVRLYNRALFPSEITAIAGMVGHWKFTDGAGTVAADSSGAGNNGTLQNGPTWSPGCGTGGLLFSGSLQHVSVPNASNLSITDTLTLTAWVKSSSLSGWHAVINKGVSASNYYLSTYNNQVSFGFYNGGWAEFTTTTANLLPNTWYHIAATFNNSSNEVKVYVNGAVALSTTTTSTPVTNTESLLIGSNETSEYWDGTIHDARVYRRVLCPSEIAAMYDLVGYWKFDEASGTTAADSSPNTRTGTLNGCTWTTGRKNGGLRFNGGTDEVTIPHSAGLSLTNGMTLATWIQPVSLSGWQAAIHKGPASSTNYWFGTYNDEIVFSLYNGGWVDIVTPNVSLTTGVWHHIAATFDNSTDTVRFYHNGTNVHTTTTTASPLANSDALHIGNDINGFPMNATLDEVRIYSRVLCPNEIYALFAGGSSTGVRIIRWEEIQ